MIEREMKRERLATIESERLLRIARVRTLAGENFSSDTAVAEWLGGCLWRWSERRESAGTVSTARRKTNLELINADNPEWTREDFARAHPAAKVLPESFMRKVRGPQKTPTKERIPIRLSRDVSK